MRKPIPFIVASTLFLCGLLVGLAAHTDSHAQQSTPAKMSDRTGALACEIITDLACLQRLRGGETNEAIAVLEVRIDGAMGGCWLMA
jgi:hypothetical protein